MSCPWQLLVSEDWGPFFRETIYNKLGHITDFRYESAVAAISQEMDISGLGPGGFESDLRENSIFNTSANH